MTIEEFLERLEEKGLSTFFLRVRLHFLACDGDERDKAFDICLELVRSCFYLSLIDVNEFVSLNDVLSSIYYGDQQCGSIIN